MGVPALSAEQRQAASRTAVAARQRRSRLSADLKSGTVTARAVLAMVDSDDAVAAMRACALIESLPRFGSRRAREAMSALRIAPTRRLRGLGTSQRRAIIALAEGPGPRG